MNADEQLLVLLGMTEQQQKTISAAVEDLKKQTASLNTVAPELQKAVQAAVVASLARSMGDVSKEAQSAVGTLNRATANFRQDWLMLAGASAAGLFFALLFTVYALVWWERSELEELRLEKAAMEETIARIDQLKGRIRLSNCGENKRPCVEVDASQAYGTEGRVYYILKGVK